MTRNLKAVTKFEGGGLETGAQTLDQSARPVDEVSLWNAFEIPAKEDSHVSLCSVNNVIMKHCESNTAIIANF